MIITLICIGLLALGIAGIIIGIKTSEDEDIYNGLGITGVFLTVIFGFGSIVCFGCICHAKWNTYNIRNAETKLINRIESLNATKQTLEDYVDSGKTLSIVDITEYNEKVAELKKDIIVCKRDLESPWLNWFSYDFFANYTPDCVSYIQ